MRCILASWLFICPVSILAQVQPDVTGSAPASEMSLGDLLKSASSFNGQIEEARQDVEIARAQLKQANAAWYPKASAVVLGAPIFAETGDAVHSQSDWGKWGPLVTGGFQIVQPVFTFGMISNYQKAAEGQIAAKEKLTEVKRAEIFVTAKEMYYSYQMANDLYNLVETLSKFLREAVDTAEKQKKEKGSIKPHDLYHLKTALDDLDQKKLYAKQGRQTAEKAILWVTKASVAGIAVTELIPEKFQKKTLEQYLEIARANRPEFVALAKGQEARGALRDAKRAQSYPIVFLGAFGQTAWCPVRTKQDSIFANDPYNQTVGGFGLGVKFDLEFARHSAEAAEQEAEMMKLKATESYAAPGIELQVKKAFWELEQAIDGLEVATRRKQTSRKWFISSGMGWSVGITPPKDLMEALEGDGLSRKNYIETVFSHNMALARLSQAVGMEVTELKY